MSVTGKWGPSFVLHVGPQLRLALDPVVSWFPGLRGPWSLGPLVLLHLCAAFAPVGFCVCAPLHLCASVPLHPCVSRELQFTVANTLGQLQMLRFAVYSSDPTSIRNAAICNSRGVWVLIGTICNSSGLAGIQNAVVYSTWGLDELQMLQFATFLAL